MNTIPELIQHLADRADEAGLVYKYSVDPYDKVVLMVDDRPMPGTFDAIGHSRLVITDTTSREGDEESMTVVADVVWHEEHTDRFERVAETEIRYSDGAPQLAALGRRWLDRAIELLSD